MTKFAVLPPRDWRRNQSEMAIDLVAESRLGSGWAETVAFLGPTKVGRFQKREKNAARHHVDGWGRAGGFRHRPGGFFLCFVGGPEAIVYVRCRRALQRRFGEEKKKRKLAAFGIRPPFLHLVDGERETGAGFRAAVPRDGADEKKKKIGRATGTRVVETFLAGDQARDLMMGRALDS